MTEKEITTIKIQRTGETYSIASTEYEVLYNGERIATLWSPPWHDWSKEEEDRRAFIEGHKKVIEFLETGKKHIIDELNRTDLGNDTTGD